MGVGVSDNEALKFDTIPEDWMDDYPALRDLFGAMSFSDAFHRFSDITDIELTDVNKNGLLDDMSSYRRGLLGDASFIGDRANSWNVKYKSLLAPDFFERGDAVYGMNNTSDLFYSLSSDLFTVPPSDYLAYLDDFLLSNGADDSDYVYRYFLTMGLIFSMQRPQATVVPYVKYGESLDNGKDEILRRYMTSTRPNFDPAEEADYDLLQDIMILNHDLLLRFRKLNANSRAYPIEMKCHQNGDEIYEYCRAVLRLILGRKSNFSDVLQESLFISQVAHLGGYICSDGATVGAKLGPAIEALKDLRMRIFEHRNLMSASPASSGIIRPPASFVNDNVRIGLDFGSGAYGRFPHAMGRAWPQVDWHGFDIEKKGGDARNVRLHQLDLDDPAVIAGIQAAFAGRVNFVTMFNASHKLSRAKRSVRFGADDILQPDGHSYLIHPAYSSYVDERSVGRDAANGVGRMVGGYALRSLRDSDTTKYPNSLFSFEDLMDLMLKIHDSVQVVCLGISNHSENDGVSRIHLVSRKLH